MSAPVTRGVEAEIVTPALLGVELYRVALRGEVALSDGEGCADVLFHRHPGLDIRDRAAARRVAIDLVQHTARHPDTALVTACRSALALIGDVTGGRGEAEPHAVLAQIADLLDGALSLTSD